MLNYIKLVISKMAYNCKYQKRKAKTKYEKQRQSEKKYVIKACKEQVELIAIVRLKRRNKTLVKSQILQRNGFAE